MNHFRSKEQASAMLIKHGGGLLCLTLITINYLEPLTRLRSPTAG